MARADVKDIDMGWNQILKEIEEFKSSTILIGFQEGSTTTREVKGQRIKEGDLSMPEIAVQNEFGTNTIPARSFMRTSFDENLPKIKKLITQQYDQVVLGSQKSQNALDAIGSVVQGFIVTKIRQIVSPPNSPRTIAEKGSSKPLIDFGQMIQSVTYQVKK